MVLNPDLKLEGAGRKGMCQGAKNVPVCSAVDQMRRLVTDFTARMQICKSATAKVACAGKQIL